jgi:hypothetical protein
VDEYIVQVEKELAKVSYFSHDWRGFKSVELGVFSFVLSKVNYIHSIVGSELKEVSFSDEK